MDGRTFELGFAKFLEKFHEEIKERFVDDAINKRELLSHYQLGPKLIEDLADSICPEFAKNIDKRTTAEYIADEYVKLGIRCHEDGLSFSEMIRVFILLKRHIWLFFQESNFAGQPFDVRSIVALNNRTALFFDRAMYYFLVGYEESMMEDSSDLRMMYESFVHKIAADVRHRLQVDERHGRSDSHE